MPIGARLAWAVGFAFFAVPALAATVGYTQNGKVTGVKVGDMDEFLGIRFAAPPVGDLRWQPPQAVPAAMATHQATAFGAFCPQVATDGSASGSEDCLFLNVYTPAKPENAGTKLPVMVWIYGGSFTGGASNLYNPAPLLAARNVIVVTINYRVGYLGFLAESGLDAEGHTAANYGLMDQQYALSWVNRNIAGFGGDPGKVTIFGESAGGESTLSNLVSPTAHGLFSQAIAESGSYTFPLPTLSQAEGAGNALATALGCATDDTACLRSVPADTILSQQSPALILGPIVDGTVLPMSISAALKTGRFNRVPLINGSNHDEYRSFAIPYAGITAAGYAEFLIGGFGSTLGNAILAEYPAARYAKPVLALAAALTDYGFACPTHQTDLLAARFVPVYAYEFNDRHAPVDFTTYPGFALGAYHGAELQYLFDLPVLPGTRPFSTAELALSAKMTRYWTDFATRQSPSGNGVPIWLPLAPATDNIQSFVPPTAAAETNFVAAHHCRFWAPLVDPS